MTGVISTARTALLQNGSINWQQLGISLLIGVIVLIFGITYFIADKFLIYDSNLFEFIPGLLLFVTLGVGSYLTITYLLDKRTRELSKMIINEIHLMLKR